MILLRIIIFIIPQLLIFLFVAGSHDLLGGWNQTDNAMGTLLVLFLLSPTATLSLLIIESVHFYKAAKEMRGRLLLFIGLALCLFLEALAIDFYLLTQVRM